MSHARQMIDAAPYATGFDAGELAAAIDAMSDCTQTCTACADASLHEDDVKDMRRCIGLCSDCADVGTATFEQERDEGIADQLEEQLAAIERAERRLADGTYGKSVVSGEPIPDARLEAIPWAERTEQEEARTGPA